MPRFSEWIQEEERTAEHTGLSDSGDGAGVDRPSRKTERTKLSQLMPASGLYRDERTWRKDRKRLLRDGQRLFPPCAADVEKLLERRAVQE